MASFAYEAINRNGRAVKGSVEADTLEHARTEVKKMGLTPVDVKPQGVLNKDLNIEIGGKPSPRDLSIFCRHSPNLQDRRTPFHPRSVLSLCTQDIASSYERYL